MKTDGTDSEPHLDILPSAPLRPKAASLGSSGELLCSDCTARYDKEFRQRLQDAETEQHMEDRHDDILHRVEQKLYFSQRQNVMHQKTLDSYRTHVQYSSSLETGDRMLGCKFSLVASSAKSGCVDRV